MTDERAPHGDTPATAEPLSFGMLLLRYVLPGVVVVAGVIVMALGSETELEGGAGIAGAGLAIFAMNWLIRASTDGDRERDREEQAREFYAEHGRWPDEAPSDAPAPQASSEPFPHERAAAPAHAGAASGAAAQRRIERPSRPPRARGSQHP